MSEFRQYFQERVADVDAYIGLITAIEHGSQTGSLALRAPQGNAATVSLRQLQILYAGVYLHLYNLIESTITQCVSAVQNATTTEQIQVHQLSPELRQEWVRTTAKTHQDLNIENRLKTTVKLCELIVQQSPVRMEISLSGGGNWDDKEIEQFTTQIGISMHIPSELRSQIKRPFQDNIGPISLVKNQRNKLAHGEAAFSECGQGRCAEDFRRLKELIVNYLTEVIVAFEKFIQQRLYLDVNHRARPSSPSGC